MSQSLVDTLHDRPGEQTFEIQTGGEIVKPFLNPINQLVDECQLSITDDGWTVRAVDPANVGAVGIELHASAFETYTVTDDVTYGVPIPQLRHQVKRARMHNDDELLLEGFEKQIDTTVRRESSAGNIVFENWMRTIDPDSVRDNKGLDIHPDEYELDLHSVTFDTSDILEAFRAVVGDYEHVRVSNEGGDLSIRGEFDREILEGSAIRVEGAGSDEEMVSLYSSDYLRDILAGIKQSKSNEVTLWYGHDIPLFLEATRTVDDEDIMHLTYMLAPRIQS